MLEFSVADVVSIVIVYVNVLFGMINDKFASCLESLATSRDKEVQLNHKRLTLLCGGSWQA